MKQNMRDKLANAIDEAVRSFGLRVHESDGVKIVFVPERDLIRIVLEPINAGTITMSTLNKPKGSA